MVRSVEVATILPSSRRLSKGTFMPAFSPNSVILYVSDVEASTEFTDGRFVITASSDGGIFSTVCHRTGAKSFSGCIDERANNA